MNSAPEKVRNILVVAITRMGDMLQASPTLVGLRKQYPNARITVAIEKQFSRICDGIPCIDELIELDLNYVCRCLAREREGIVDAFRYLSEKVEVLRERNFDFSLNMSSSAYTALLLKMLGIEDCRGWVSDDEGYRVISSPWAMLFSAFVYHSNRDYNSLNLVDIFRCASGVSEHPRRLQYEVSEAGRRFAGEFLETSGITGSGPLICIQAGASQEKRQWAPTKFARLSQILIQELDARLVFVGSKSELRIIDRIVGEINHSNVVVAAGKTDFAQLGGILERADVLITGDTGPMHLAVAVGTRVVSLFLASALAFETGPYGEGNLVMQPLVSCNPCNPNLACARPDCHDQITPELVAYLTRLRLETQSATMEGVRIPRSVANPADVAISVTTFDEDGFLDFKQLNELAPRHGRAGEFYKCARDAYRWMWKQEFGFSREKREGIKDPTRLPEDLQSGILELCASAEEGEKLIAQVCRLIKDPKSPPKMLGETTRALEQIDKNIEDIGLGHPVLGALVRMFVMEKENMRGDDPLRLASEMGGLYRTLASRAELYGELFVLSAVQIGWKESRTGATVQATGTDLRKETLVQIMGAEHR